MTKQEIMARVAGLVVTLLPLVPGQVGVQAGVGQAGAATDAKTTVAEVHVSARPPLDPVRTAP